VAHGSVNSGYCLMIEDGHLVYDYNYYGEHHLVRSSDPVPAGHSTLAMQFLIDPDATSGIAELFIGDVAVGSMHLPETFEHFVSWQGVDIGADRLSPVRHDADTDGNGEYPFQGKLSEIVYELLDDVQTRPYEPRD
jgi:arylsulfatase